MVSLQPRMDAQEVYIPYDDKYTASYHVFFITGNPGCIGYYHSFLTALSTQVSEDKVDIYGHSLYGFIDDPPPSETYNNRRFEGRKVLSLGEQTLFIEETLNLYAEENIDRTELVTGNYNPVFPDPHRLRKDKPIKIILIGHSVGAYIGLEILRLHKKRGSRDVEIIGFVGLWPTVTWIGKSPSGLRFGWLIRTPGFDFGVWALAKILTTVTSKRKLKALIKFVTSMPDDAADVTMQFLRSRWGVRQALFMARDEMRNITEDRWEKDVWGSGQTSSNDTSARLVFYFGKNDHWVADHTRDQLIASRASVMAEDGEMRPKMIIDDLDIPHGFCIRHSSIVATKTAGFIKEIIQVDQTRKASP